MGTGAAQPGVGLEAWRGEHPLSRLDLAAPVAPSESVRETHAATTTMPVQVGPLRLANLTLLASGIVDETGGSIARAVRAGAGGVVTKSVGIDPRPGHPSPSFFEVEGGGALNAMGLPNPGIEGYEEEMEACVGVAKDRDVPVIGSVFGGTKEEFVRLVGRMEDYGAAAVELNLSCPHAKGYGMHIGADPALMGPVIEACVDAVDLPVWAKLTPNVTDIGPCALAAARAGASALTLINTVKALAIDPDFRRPVLGNAMGGLSGPAVKPIGVRAMWDAWEVLEREDIDPVDDCALVGVGGVETARDALEYVLAGASAVQVGTAFLHHGYKVFDDIVTGVAAWLEEQPESDIREVVGKAHG